MTQNKNKKNLYPQGSQWRKWDLHLHTPSSYDYKNKSITNEEIIKILKQSDVSAVAITDHHIIDVERIGKLRELAGDGIAILPGIEFCSDSKGKEPIHFIGIFSDDANLNYIWTEINSKAGIAKQREENKNENEIYCNLKDTSLLIKELGGIVSIHAGSKSNSIEAITNSLPVKMAEKRDIAKYAHIFELGQEKDQKGYKEKVFSKIGLYPMIICSDNHNIKNYVIKQNCWIKADPTFEGLKQVLNEPVDRVFIGIKPPKLLEVEGNKSKYIDSIKINEIANKSDGWFNDTISLNSSLVAVIGRKGSGKSALTDIISLCGDSKIDSKDYSFLNKNKFRKPGLAKNYEATLKWSDGKENKKVNLDSDVNTITEVEKVKYLPQKFVETICNEDEGVSKLFQKEIDKVIFSYVPKTNRVGALTLDDLIKIKTESIEEKIASLRKELNSINCKIVMLENRQRKEYLIATTKTLEEKKRELNALTQPKEVKKPKSTLDKTEQNKLDKISKELDKIENEISEASSALTDTNNKITSLGRIKSAITQLQDKQSELVAKIKKYAESLSLDLTDIIKITINDSTLSQRETELNKQKKELEAKLEQNNPNSKVSLYTKQPTLKSQKDKITKAFTAEQKVYDNYCERVRQLKLQQAKIEGKEDDNTLETIKSLEKEIEYIKSKLAKDLQLFRDDRAEILRKLYQELIKTMNFYKEIYAPLTKFIKDEKATQKETGSILSFSVGMVFKKQSFMNEFFSFINRNRDGSFQTIEKGQRVLDDIIRRSNFKDAATFIVFIDEIIEHLNYDKTKPTTTENNIRSQVKNGDEGNINLYNFLFGLGYLDVKYKVLFNGKDLNNNEFSPGEKGALLLIFYLLIDRDNTPLIIDQPEENLDNESVYDLLVPYMKKAKEKRQIIAVTHNPNLAVVCDAEQVICAHMDKKLNQIRYSSGSIENPETNKRIVDVLEGTMPAFKIRDKKYIK